MSEEQSTGGESPERTAHRVPHLPPWATAAASPRAQAPQAAQHADDASVPAASEEPDASGAPALSPAPTESLGTAESPSPAASEDAPSAIAPGATAPSATAPGAAAADAMVPGATAPDAAPSEPAAGEPAQSASDDLELERWLRQVEVYTGPDALLDFNQVDNLHIDLTDANPSGYAQLLAGRRTRLSTLLRDRKALATGMRAAQAIRAKTFELDAGHGLSAGFLAVGMASWITRERTGGRASGEKRFIAPVLLVPVVILPHPDGEDFDLRTSGRPRLNPAMVRQLYSEYGINLDTTGLQERASSGSRLTPEPVLEGLRAVCAQVRGMHVDSTAVVSTFADLSDTVGPLPSTQAQGLLRRISDTQRAEIGRPRPAPRPEHVPEHSDVIDPAQEVLVHDADETVSEIVQLARAGESLAVTAPAGSRGLQAALNAVAGLVAAGKSVMVLAERRSTLQQVRRALHQLDLDGLVFEPGEEHRPEALVEESLAGIVAHERSQEPDLSALHRDLLQARVRLAEHVGSLHWQEQRWGVTPYRAMQTLAELTARHPAPATRVRFTRAVLDATVDRAETAAQLERVAQLRAFDPATAEGPWHGARLVNAEETTQARALATHLAESAQDLGRRLEAALSGIGLQRGQTVSDWQDRLDLLLRLRESLGSFRPELWDQPLPDLVAATAPSSWRREHGTELSAIQRGRLRRTARELIRPQGHIDDLHRALLEVQEQRRLWDQWAAEEASAERSVAVPEDLDELAARCEHLAEELAGLGEIMQDSPAALDYLDTPLEDLLETLRAMAGDHFLLETLPERDQLLRILRSKGLGELLADLLRRQVPAEQVSAELDLAWWQSAFEIIQTRPEVNLVPGRRLAEWESLYRRAEYSHIASGPARVRHGAALGWNRAVRQKPVQAKELRGLLKGTPGPLLAYLQRAPELFAHVRPVWLASPFAVGRTLPESTRVDAVVVLDAESTPLGACLAALARTDQVIAFGDPHAGVPQPFVVSPTLGTDNPPSEEPVDSVMDVLAQALPQVTLGRIHDARDEVLTAYLNETFYDGALEALPYGEEMVGPTRSFRVDVLHRDQPEDALGAPVVDSPASEVRAVVEMVFDHAARNPRQSLAVLTATPRHAARIAEGVRYGMSRHPELAEFFAPGQEPFRVMDLARAPGLRRDRVILSLGLAADAGTRARGFGQLSGAHGRQRFVMAVTAARFHTRVVASWSGDQLEAAGARDGMADLARLMQRYRARQEQSEQFTEELTGWRRTRTESATGSSAQFLAAEDRNEEEHAQDWLLADLAHRLRGQGASVRLSPGTVPDAVATAPTDSLSAGAVPSPRARTSGQGIRGRQGTPSEQQTASAATGGESRGEAGHRYPVALVSDGTERYARMSVRERSRLLPERLERIGWNYVPVWTLDVFADPAAVSDQVRTLLGLPETELPSAAGAEQEPAAGKATGQGRGAAAGARQ